MFLSFAEDEKRHLTVLRSILTELEFSDLNRLFEGKTPTLTSKIPETGFSGKKGVCLMEDEW